MEKGSLSLPGTQSFPARTVRGRRRRRRDSTPFDDTIPWQFRVSNPRIGLNGERGAPVRISCTRIRARRGSCTSFPRIAFNDPKLKTPRVYLISKPGEIKLAPWQPRAGSSGGALRVSPREGISLDSREIFTSAARGAPGRKFRNEFSNAPRTPLFSPSLPPRTLRH